MFRRETFLPFSPPLIGQEEIDEVVDTLKSDWLTTGPKTKKFEAALGEFLQAPGKTSLALNSCTAGLHVALVTLGVKPGDEVIVPTHTFAATANVVEHVGAKPVLVDVEPDTLCIDAAAVERAITPRTKAVIPVHYAGHPADLDALDKLVAKHGLFLIEDAAHAIPTTFKGHKIGSRQNFASFSFYATKNLTTAEGGALTGDPSLLEKAQVVSLHGMSKDAWKRFDKAGSWRYDIVLPGFKYNMTDLQSALGLHQLKKLPTFYAHRRAMVERYNQAFSKLSALQVPVERKDCESSWHLYVVRLRPGALRIERDAFIEELKARNIGTSVHYTPLHKMSFYRDKYGFGPTDFPVANTASEQMVSLPLSARLSARDADDVIAAVTDVVETFGA